MKIKPKISVIMSVYNSEDYLAESIESILNQTFNDIEFIIIEDCSKDNSLKIIKQYSKKDKRIKLIKNKENLGLTKSLNIGLKIANGKYIARMDSDDISLLNRLEVQYKYLEENPNIFLLSSSYVYINNKGDEIYNYIIKMSPQTIRKKLLKRNMIIHPSVMFRNEKGIFYREKLKYAQDRDLWLRLISDGKEISVLEDILIKIRITPNSISNSSTGLKQNLILNEILKWHKERIKTGKDSYELFNIKDLDKIIRNKKFVPIDYYHANYIYVLFRSRKNMVRLRKEIRKYWGNYGLFSWKHSIIYYSLSFMPKPIINFAVRFLEG